jgi:hypothetical protein
MKRKFNEIRKSNESANRICFYVAVFWNKRIKVISMYMSVKYDDWDEPQRHLKTCDVILLEALGASPRVQIQDPIPASTSSHCLHRWPKFKSLSPTQMSPAPAPSLHNVGVEVVGLCSGCWQWHLVPHFWCQKYSWGVEYWMTARTEY